MNCKHFNKILGLVYQKSPLQKKKIEKYLAGQNETFFYSAELFAKDYVGYLESQNIPLENAVNAYLKMVGDMIKSQIFFMKTGKYPVNQAEQAYDSVYNNEDEMKSYMLGLAISQFLWSTHHEMYLFFGNALKKYGDSISSYLEIGPGHGLFLRTALQYLNVDASITVIDISHISIEITKSIMNFFSHTKASQISYHKIDIFNFDSSKKYNFITMGEVLEHVDYPEKLLVKLSSLLNKEGKAFISTCVDCPTIDHVYHFKSVDHIRKMLNSCGLLIEDERVLPVEDLPMKEVIEKKITINYCAIVKRKT